MEDLEQKAGGQGPVLSKDDIDTIGEILNISMGSAATAMSALLDRQVVITPPTVSLEMPQELDYAELEPAILVKIQYVKGISGSNVMLFRQNDMQVILNLLMGTDDPPRPDFEFDELSMSAACEVMNQMMGASATALSDVLGDVVDISTPDAYVVTSPRLEEYIEAPIDRKVVAISFGMSIADVMETSFASIMSCELAAMIIKQVLGDQAANIEKIEPIVQPSAAAPAQAPAAPAPAPSAPAPAAPAAPPAAPPVPPAMPPVQPQQPAAMPPEMAAAYMQQPQQPMMMPNGMPAYPGYPYPPYPGYPYPPQPVPSMEQQPNGMMTDMGMIRQPMNVQTAQFPTFSAAGAVGPISSSSMDLLMNVPLSVSVEIGKTKRKIKEIVDFGQGTVIELDKQAGAPVDIVVNGQLIAKGDVVVIGDNFGVRVTEILGTKDLMESLGNGQ